MHGREYTEALRLRIADRDRLDDESRADQVGDAGAPVRVGVTTTVTTYPTAAARFYAITPYSQITGTETEGSTGTLTSGTGTFFALNVGTAIPPSGTNVVCTFVDYRWTFCFN